MSVNRARAGYEGKAPYAKALDRPEPGAKVSPPPERNSPLASHWPVPDPLLIMPHACPSLSFRLVFTAALSVLMLWGASSLKAFDTVILDPGHGGHDRGAGVGYVFEKHMALDTARRVQALLESKGLKVIMTRSNDEFITLDGRSTIGNSYGNAIFVSVHYNYSRPGSGHGVETYHHYDSSYTLAAYIQAYLVKETGMENRGVKSANFHVIRETTRVPAVLVECGFVSNPAERSGMLKGGFRENIALGIAKGILAYHQLR